MKKILVCLLLATLLLFSLLLVSCKKDPPPAAEGELRFIALDDGDAYEVAAGTATGATITVPATYNGKPVVAVARQGFYQHKTLQTLILPDSVTRIGAAAFQDCAALSSVTMEGVTSVGDRAFRGCDALLEKEGGVLYVGEWAVGYESGAESISLRDGTLGVADAAFRYAAVREVTLPDSLTLLGSYAFECATSLQEIEIPTGVEVLSAYAFADCAALSRCLFADDGALRVIEGFAFFECTALTELDLPDSLTVIGEGVFLGCSDLIETVDDVQYVDTWAVGVVSTATAARLRDGTVGVAEAAFRAQTSLLTAYLPQSLCYIGEEAFAECPKLVEVRNLSSLSLSAGSDALGGVAANAKEILGDGDPSHITSEGDFYFYRKGEENLLLHYVGSATAITLPGGAPYAICHSAFYHSDLTSVVFTGSVKSIGDSAFAGCASLYSLSFCDGLTEIGDHAFQNCTAITAVYSPATLTKIGDSAFAGCSALESVQLSAQLQKLGGYAFGGCVKLAEIYTPLTCEAWEDISFGAEWDDMVGWDAGGGYVIYCEDGSIEKNN